MFYLYNMEEEIYDLHKVKFTSSEQFLIGEKIKVISYTPSDISIGYGGLVGKRAIIMQNYDGSVLNNHFTNTRDIYISTEDNSNYHVNVVDLDLAIEDEKLYTHIKSERLKTSNLYLEYRKIEMELLKKKLYDSNKIILDVFEEVFPGKFDYNFNNNILECIIHFPEITVKNSENAIHNIVDLYIKLSFGSDKRIHSINGTRSVVTLAEKMSNYRHSHISTSGNFYGWLSCCLGESEFAQTYSLLCNSFNIDNLTRFLYQLPEYLSWESLEGGPYKKMKEINSGSNIPNSVGQTDIDRTYKKLLENINNIPVKVNRELIDIFQIENNTTLEELILPIAGNLVCNKVNNTYLLDSSSENTKLQINRLNKEIEHVTMFTFKGTPIKPRIIASTEENNEAIKAPYPTLTQGISNILTKKFNEYVISESNK